MTNESAEIKKNEKKVKIIVRKIHFRGGNFHIMRLYYRFGMNKS